MKPPIVFCCAECGRTPKLVTGETIYPYRQDLYDKLFYLCTCGAYVGCHSGTENALGSPASAALRKARSDAHALFDPLWRKKQALGFSKKDARHAAYVWLATDMGIPISGCHFSQLNLAQCTKALEILNNWYGRQRK